MRRRHLALLATPALAQARAIRLLVPFGAGGISDVVSRIVAEAAAAVLGQPIIIENRTGAAATSPARRWPAPPPMARP